MARRAWAGPCQPPWGRPRDRQPTAVSAEDPCAYPWARVPTGAIPPPPSWYPVPVRRRTPQGTVRLPRLKLPQESHESCEVVLGVVGQGEVTAVRAVVIAAPRQLLGHPSQ